MEYDKEWLGKYLLLRNKKTKRYIEGLIGKEISEKEFVKGYKPLTKGKGPTKTSKGIYRYLVKWGVLKSPYNWMYK